MTVLEYGKDIIVIDCGVEFPTSDLLGIDLVVPDITYLVQNKEKIRGFLITHGHEDHIGSIPYVVNEINAPIYASKMTCGLIKKKMDQIIKQMTMVSSRDTVSELVECCLLCEIECQELIDTINGTDCDQKNVIQYTLFGYTQ